MNSIKKLLLPILTLLLIGYAAICGYFYTVQESIIFHPRELEENARYDYAFQFEERWFEPEEGVRIHAVHAFTGADSAKGLVMYLHGNRGANRTDADKYTIFLDNGYDMIYPDYRVYGKSRGELDGEEDLVGDIRHVFEQVAKEYGEENIVMVGYSLGSGVAAQVAKHYNPRMLILWTPFKSLVDVKDSEYPFLPDFLMRYTLRTDLALPKIEEPVHIFYAGADELLLVERSFKLIEYLKEGDSYTIIEGQRHGWIYRHPELRNGLRELLE